MTTFKYTARSRAGERTEGTVEAHDRRSAMLQIERLGYVPVSVAEEGVSQKEPGKKGLHLTRGGRPRMKTRELLLFTTEFSDLLASGMRPANALNSLANRAGNRAADRIVKELRDEIIRGSSLSDALAKYPETFSPLYVNMIRAGETGGAMHEILKRLVVHYERVQEAKEKIIMALVYPVIVLLLGTGIMIFTMVVIVPKFEQVFEALGETLPVPTQILVSSSRWLASYGWALAAGLVLFGFFAHRALKTEKGKLWWHGLLLKLPLARGIVSAGIYANFARTLGTLMDNGVPVLNALRIVERAVGNTVISRELANARERVTDGTTISGPLAAGKVFPRMMTDMLAVGEESGDVAGTLKHIASRYDSELDRNLKIFTTLLEPILIVVIAVLVGFVAVSIFMAVFSLTSGLNA
ncbi:MAG: type II secretion system F family protein [Kiritimatiellia bacterium]